MRLDKMISSTGVASRSQISSAVRSGRVTVDGVVARKADMQVDPDAVRVVYCGTPVCYRKFTYIMLNKPEGYVSATEDGKSPTVIELLPEELQKIGLFPCGRLDKNTLGLMLLTNDGDTSHRLLAPKSHVAKTYAFRVKFPLSEADVAALESGVDIGGYITAPCTVVFDGEREGRITLTEGKYHQIKLMMEAVHNQITYLERVSFGPLTLDPALDRGQWRYLDGREIALLQKK
ncbi:MAG: rRNA pseudouridine synthase [Clostridia bacterium]|nr:rRNA pseudouridine synthase [Clostridia bacterium]